MYGFNKGLRQKRPFSDTPVIRSETADKIVQVACICLGIISLGASLFALILILKESP